jgi:phosphatase NudJ
MSIWKPSVTVAAVVERDARFLLVEEHTRDGLRLNQPAGHLDPGESLLQAVGRETLEETAHRVDPSACVGIYMSRYVSQADGTDVTYMRFAFVCDLLGEEPGRALDDGIVRTLWLSADEVRERSAMHRSPLVMRTIDDYCAGRRYPLDMIFTHPSCLDGLDRNR